MPTKIRPVNAIKVSNVCAALERKRFRLNTPSRITPEGEFYLLDGVEVPVQEFNKMFPEISLVPVAKKGGNSDRTKNWMHDAKSY